MVDFLLLRRMMLAGGGGRPLEPIENRYFIAFLVGGVVYITGIKFDKWNEDGLGNVITIPDTINVGGVDYPTMIDSDPYFREGLEV